MVPLWFVCFIQIRRGGTVDQLNNVPARVPRFQTYSILAHLVVIRLSTREKRLTAACHKEDYTKHLTLEDHNDDIIICKQVSIH